MAERCTLLYAAIEQGNLADCRYLLDKVVDVNHVCPPHYTLMHLAVRHNRTEVVDMLLRRGASMTISLESVFMGISVGMEKNALFNAFEMGPSHEAIQTKFLDKIVEVGRSSLKTHELEEIKKIPRHAMMFCTSNVFLKAQQMAVTMDTVVSDGLNPLMYTFQQITLRETDLAKCRGAMENVLQIVKASPGMAWDRLAVEKKCTVEHTFRRANSEIVHARGSTALAMLLFDVMPHRKEENKKNIVRSQHQVSMAGMLASFAGPHLIPGIVTHMKETELLVAKKDAEIVEYLANDIVPCFFVEMIWPMRTALGMSTHVRLGANENCCIGQLGADLMDVVFKCLVDDISDAPDTFRHMLC